jgi:hypothetical protein
MRELFNCSLFYLLSQSKIDCTKYILRMAGIWKMLRQVPEVSHVMSSMHARENGNTMWRWHQARKERMVSWYLRRSTMEAVNCHTCIQKLVIFSLFFVYLSSKTCNLIFLEVFGGLSTCIQMVVVGTHLRVCCESKKKSIIHAYSVFNMCPLPTSRHSCESYNFF